MENWVKYYEHLSKSTEELLRQQGAKIMERWAIQEDKTDIWWLLANLKAAPGSLRSWAELSAVS